MDLNKISLGDAPENVNVVIEVSANSNVKYEMDKESGALMVDRFLHTPMFYQVEGLTVGEGISFANLKFVLINLLKEVFGTQTSVRFRPTYYPYTEPSAAIDMSCPKCNKKGCALCGGAGWITVLGSGMVHPNVLENANVDTKKYSGFAFGLGLNRLAMIYFDMNGIREFYENDIFMWNQL